MQSKELSFGEVTVGVDKPAVVIAELACEHRGNMDEAKRLIRAAKDAGADIAKFQLHVPEAEMVADHPDMKFWAGSMDEVLKEVNFGTKAEHGELKTYCEEVGIQYLCTPFCIAAADILEEVGVVGYKIGSGELTNLPMLRHIARYGKPMILSTGMSVIKEIEDAVKVLTEENVPFMLLHCLSEYPASYEHMNLGLIQELSEKFGVMTGFSDHSTEVYADVAAVALGARVIEKHFTIRDLQGPDDIVSLDPEQFAEMVRAIRNIEAALGDTREVSSKEAETRSWAHHSIVAAQDIAEGEKLTNENLTVKRPGGGIPAAHFDPLYGDIVGKKATRFLQKDTLLSWDDLK